MTPINVENSVFTLVHNNIVIGRFQYVGCQHKYIETAEAELKNLYVDFMNSQPDCDTAFDSYLRSNCLPWWNLGVGHVVYV